MSLAARVVQARTRSPSPERDPAILASSHEAETSARRATEFEMTDSPSVQQEHRKQAVAFDSLDGMSIDRQAQGSAVTGNDPQELPSRRPLSWLVRHPSPPCFYRNAITFVEW